MLHVFVYGTLKPGYTNYHRYCSDRIVSAVRAMVLGQLFDLPACGYPAMTVGESWVKGYLLSFADETVLKALDDLEDYRADRAAAENEYLRQWLAVFDEQQTFLRQAWGYTMSRDRIQEKQGVCLLTGEWLGPC